MPTTKWRTASPGECVVYPDLQGGANAPRYLLGPAKVTTAEVQKAHAEFVPNQGWTVRLRLTPTGSAKWDSLARGQFHQQVAVTASGRVVAAPTIQPNNADFESFGGVAVISGAFTRKQAEALALLAAPDKPR